MCDTTAIARTGEGESVILENVDIIRPEGGEVYMRNLFGEEARFKGRIVEISLRRNRITLEAL